MSWKVLGQVIQNIFPRPTEKVFKDWKLSKLSSFCLLVIIWQTYDQAFASQAFTSVKPNNMIFIVFISIAFYTIWLAVCFTTSIPWLPKKDTIAVAYCVPAKTPAMGVPLASVMFFGMSAIDQSKIQIPLVIYQGLQLVISSVLLGVFRSWVKSDEEREAIEKAHTESEESKH